MDVIHALVARYCIRQDARGLLELWAVLVVLAAAFVALVRRRATRFLTGVFVVFWVLTAGLASTVFLWCFESAAPSLGTVLPSSPKLGLGAMICLNSHALEIIDGWILIVISCIGASLLLVLNGRLKSTVGRGLSFAGIAGALLFATANSGLILFSAAWCQSNRLF
jgi:hypothetical protein